MYSYFIFYNIFALSSKQAHGENNAAIVDNNDNNVHIHWKFALRLRQKFVFRKYLVACAHESL